MLKAKSRIHTEKTQVLYRTRQRIEGGKFVMVCLGGFSVLPAYQLTWGIG